MEAVGLSAPPIVHPKYDAPPPSPETPLLRAHTLHAPERIDANRLIDRLTEAEWEVRERRAWASALLSDNKLSLERELDCISPVLEGRSRAKLSFHARDAVIAAREVKLSAVLTVTAYRKLLATVVELLRPASPPLSSRPQRPPFASPPLPTIHEEPTANISAESSICASAARPPLTRVQSQRGLAVGPHAVPD